MALTFTFGGDQRILSSWSSTFSQTQADVTLRNMRWNGRVAPGASVTAGLLGARTTANTPPASFALNGRPCAVG